MSEISDKELAAHLRAMVERSRERWADLTELEIRADPEFQANSRQAAALEAILLRAADRVDPQQ